MASACSHRIASLWSPKPSLNLPKRPSISPFQFHCPIHFKISTAGRGSSSVSTSSGSFTWDDVVRVSQPESCSGDDHPSNLQGYFEKIKFCNRGSEMQCNFLPFVIEGQIFGYMHKEFSDHLRGFNDAFIFHQDSSSDSRFHVHVGLHPSLKMREERTDAVAHVVECLGEALIPGIRNELFPVKSSFGSPIIFSLERAAAPYFGIKAYGIHMSGYVERKGQEYLWIARRSQAKSTFPGMLDHLVAGGLPHDITCGENVVKECEEEAGIPRAISSRAIPVGAVSYVDIDGFRFKRDVLFCYDLKLPEDFIPNNQDGEVESFKLISAPQVANIVRRTSFYKPNCSLVIIDFLVRHGHIKPEYHGYLDLLRSLKSGDCS